MPKVPGVTRDLLQKQILELLEGIGIPAKEWIGKGGSTVRRLVTKTELSPFKPNMLSAMSQQKKTFGDALDAFSNEAKFIMNANDQELMNFKNNITDYTSVGGTPRDPGGEGLASMMKTLDDLGKEAKDLKTTTQEMKDLAQKNIDDLYKSLEYGGDPFKVPDKTSVGGSMYAEGNIRTAVREFMQSELKAGRLTLDKTDTFRITEYSPMSEDDPIHVFRRIYGEDALEAVDNISKVFEKGESFKHYEQLLRENVDNKFLIPKKTGAGELDPNVKAAEDIRNKVKEGKIKTVVTWDEKLGEFVETSKSVDETSKSVDKDEANKFFKKTMDDVLEKSTKEEPSPDPTIDDPDDIPFYAGGRVGLKYGTKKLFNFTKKQLLDAVNDIFPTGDRKYDAQMVAESLVENNPTMFKNKLHVDLPDREYSEIYGIALDALDAFNAEAKALMKPKIDFEDPKVKSALDKAGQKGIALSDAAKIMGYDMSKQKDYFLFEEAISGGMEGWPKEVKEQVIRAKYGDVVDQKLLDNMLVDDDHFRLAEVFATVEQGLKMQETGMGPDEIVTAIKAGIDRKPNAAGGGIGSLFKGTDRVGLVKGTTTQYAGKTMKEILDSLMKHKKIRDLVEQVNKKLHETGITKMWTEERTLNDKDKIVAEKVIAPFVETVDKMRPWKGSEKGARNATLAWFREEINNPKFKEVYHPNWEKGKTVFRGMKHPDDLQYSKEHPSNMFMTEKHAKMFKPENVGAFASEYPGWAIKFATEAKGFPHVKKTHLSPIEFQESVERNLIENPYGVTSDVILDAEKKAALETDIIATGIAAFKKYWPFNEGGTVDKQNLNEDGVGSMFREV
jgi:hypothetical protein